MKIQIRGARKFFSLLWDTVLRFIREEGMNHAAALSYYTVFALPPILIILISMVGFFWGEVEIEMHLFEEMSGVFGSTGAEQIKLMLDKLKQDGNTTVTYFGIGTLIFSSTIVFYSIQHSLNRLWEIHHEIRHGFIKWVLDKFLSLSFIIIFGFLLSVSLGVQASVAAISHYFGATLESTFSQASTGSEMLDSIFNYIHWLYEEYFSFGFYVLEYVLTLVVNVVMFAGIFKFLPDAKSKWKVALVGGLVTAVLFELGQIAIAWKIGTTDFGNSFGAAGALITVFVWIFYSSCILYYGGLFTFYYGKMIDSPVVPVKPKNH